MEGGKVEVRGGTPEPAQRLHVQQRELPEGGRLAEENVHHGDVALEEGGVGLAQLQPQCPQQGLVQALNLDDATQAESVYRKKKRERVSAEKRKGLRIKNVPGEMRTNAEKIASSDSVSLRSAMSSAKANACVTSFVSVRSAKGDWIKF